MANLRPDWRAYFLDFCQRHGGDPVEAEGRLLFRDGWGYAHNNYRGPEYPPPNSLDELARLQLVYWRRRREILVRKRDKLMYDMESLAQAQQVRSAPIPVKGIQTVQDDTGRLMLVPTALTVQWQDLKLELQSVVDDVDAATRNVQELEGLVPVEEYAYHERAD